jgi:branched-chain amino acid transport system permease protein
MQSKKPCTGRWGHWPLVLPLVLQFRQRLGAHRRLALLYVMLALGLNIVGLRRPAGSGLCGVLRRGRLYVGLMASPHLAETFLVPAACSQTAAPSHLAGDSAAALLAACTGCCWDPGAEAARRLPGHRDAGLRRDHPHLHEQPGPAGQHHQRPQGHGQIDSVKIFGVDLAKRQEISLDISSVTLYYYLFLVLVLITVVICYRLQDAHRPRLDGDPRRRSPPRPWASMCAT